MLLLALLLQAASASHQLTEPDTYAIYAVVIPSEWPVRNAHATKLVIQDTTEVDEWVKDCPVTAPNGERGWAEAIEDFNRQNASSWRLVRSFPLEVSYELVAKDAITAAFKGQDAGGGWRGFHAAHPDAKGFFHVSAVGFDKTRTRAIVYVSHFCGGLCGGGGYHYLQREAGTWRVARPNAGACGWVS